MQRTVTTLILIFCSLFSFATKIKGKITDQSGDAVPFATLFVTGTNLGTSANEDGEYFIDLPEGNATLTARMIGFKPEAKTINATGAEMTLNFKLLPEGQLMKEVVVKASGEDPAYAIMRNVIANKTKHQKLIKTLETEIYLKGKMKLRQLPTTLLGYKMNAQQAKEFHKGLGVDSNNTIMYLLEQITHYSYKAPDKEFNEIKAIRTSGDPQGLGFASMPPITNIYDNNIDIIPGIGKRGFISPANNNAFLYYRFKFINSYAEDGMMINKIQVIPRRNYEPLFTGFVYVVEDEWVFQQVKLTLDKTAQMDLLDTLRLQQQYRKTPTGNWVIQQQILYPATKLMGFDIVGDFVTNYSNQRINEPIDNSKFERKTFSVYDKNALKQDSTFWEEKRPIPLLDEEKRDYVQKDSARLKNLARQDSLSKKYAMKVTVQDVIIGGISLRKGKNNWTLDGLLPSVGFNTVEGLVLSLNPAWQRNVNRSDAFSLTWKNRYGFANKGFQSLINFEYKHITPEFREKNWRINADVGQYVFQINNNNPITPFLNEITSLVWGRNHMKLYQNRLAKIGFVKNYGTGFSWNAALSYEQRTAMENHTNYIWNKEKADNYTPNNPLTLPAFQDHNAFIASLGFWYQPGWKYIEYPDYKRAVSSDAPIFSGKYTKGFAGVFDSKTDFDKWAVSVEHALSLKLLGRLDYRFVGGGFINKKFVGNPDMYHLFGNQTILANPYLNSFQLASYYRFSSTPDLYLQAHGEWHLNGLLTNKIPLFKRLNWHLIGAGNLMFINKNQYYGEVSVGLENIGYKLFRFGRIDFVAGYESGKSKPTVGIRLGLGEVLWELLGINNRPSL